MVVGIWHESVISSSVTSRIFQCCYCIILPAVNTFVCFVPAEMCSRCVCLFPGQVSRSSIPTALRWCTALPCPSSLAGAKCLELHLSQPCPAPASTSPEPAPSSHRCTCQTRAHPLTGALVTHVLRDTGLSLGAGSWGGVICSSALGVKNSHTSGELGFFPLTPHNCQLWSCLSRVGSLFLKIWRNFRMKILCKQEQEILPWSLIALWSYPGTKSNRVGSWEELIQLEPWASCLRVVSQPDKFLGCTAQAGVMAQ